MSYPVLKCSPRARTASSALARTVLCLALCFGGAAAVACELDMDCEAGSSCTKEPGNIEGACTGGLFPGNENDDTVKKHGRDPHSTRGEFCIAHGDCDPGQSCVKNASGVSGVCI